MSRYMLQSVAKWRKWCEEPLIGSFNHKGLEELFITGSSRKIRHDLAERTLRRLDALREAENLGDLQGQGFNFHALHGKPKRYTLHVNGPWCITFEWANNRAWRINLEQYH